MLRRAIVITIAIMALFTVVVLAGHEGKKCAYSTQECLDHMAAKMKNMGFVGVELDKDEATGALKVLRVIPDSPAEAAGIQAGDVLFALNGVRISEDNEKALQKVKKEWAPGQSVTYTIKRDGADREVTLTLAPMTADVMAKWIGSHMLEHASTEIAEKKN
jgi:C-terminal processing protease CtpA/Prc